MRLNDYVTFRCAPDLRKAVEAVAGQRGVSNAIRDAVAEYVERRQPKAEKRPAPSRSTTAAAA